ncbi:MAG: ABC transporter ATP-binding protein, partial [Finegoldia magna]|nr:ABC transporter ATP-binding protein [Finegoldia magna]
FYVFIFVLDFLVSVITSNFADEFVKLNTEEFQNTIKTMLIIILVFGVKFLSEKLIPYKLELKKHQLKFQFKNNILRDIYNLRKELLFELSGEQVLQIVDKDSEIIASFRYEYLVEFFSSLFIFAMVLVSFLVLSCKVTFIFALLAILQIIPPIITKNSLYKIYMDTRKIEQDTTNWIISASDGRDVLKTFNASEWYFKNKRNLDELNVNAGTKAEIAFALENAMYSLLDLILKIVSYAIIGIAIYNQEITIADSVFMIMLLSTFYSNFENITKYISKVQEFNVSKTRINNILNKDINSNDVTVSDTDSLIDLKIEDLDFCQNLNGTNLKLEKGDKILISGSNGKGKTTIFNLILGLLHSNS